MATSYQMIRSNCNCILIENDGTDNIYIKLVRLTLDDLIAGMTLDDLEEYIPNVTLLPTEKYNITLPSNYIYGIIVKTTIPPTDLTPRSFIIHSTSLYTIFCDIIECRKKQLLRVLGESDNCKEECDCISVYDFNAFSILYEHLMIPINNINLSENNNQTITQEMLDTITDMYRIQEQALKYCIECFEPCKDC